jgi:hypothetical protein
MSIKSFRYFLKGIELRGETTDPTDNAEGSIFQNSTDARLRTYIQGAVRNIVTDSQTQTLTNKTIDGDLNTLVDIAESSIKTNLTNANKFILRDVTGAVVSNTKDVPTGAVVGTSDTQTFTNKTFDANATGNSISNLETADLAAGVLNTSTSLSGASNTQVPSALAAKSYTDAAIVAAATGNVIGPASATDNAIARFDTTTGKLIQNSVVTVSDTGVVVGASIDADTNTITNIENADIKAGAAIARNKLASGTNNAVVFNDGSGVMSNAADLTVTTNALTLANTKHLELQAATDSTTTGTAATLTAFNASAIRLTNSSLVSLANIPSGNDGQELVLFNRTGASIAIADDSASLGTAARRIYTGTGTTITFANNSALILQYDNTSVRWQIIGGTGSGTGGAELPPSVLAQQTFETAAIGDFTQTGLNLISAPAGILIKGTKVAQLIHQAASSQSFKQTIAVDRLFRNKLMTMTLDIKSTATAGNLTILFRDETNSADIGVAQAFTIASQAITIATTSGLPTLAALSNSVINTLFVGMSVTGSGIPTSTTISAINTSTGVVTLSANATASATVTARFSALPARNTFSFTMPVGCASFSYTITALQEANLPESYIDDIYIQLSEAAKTSTSISVYKNNDTNFSAYVPTFTGFGSVTTSNINWRRVGGSVELEGTFVIGTATATEQRMSLPNSIVSSTGINVLELAGEMDTNANLGTIYKLLVLKEPSVSYVTFGAQASGTPGLAKTASSGPYPSAGSIMTIKASIPIQGWSATDTETKTIDLTSSVLVTQPDSMVRVQGSNGFGSTNTKIARFSNLLTTVGTSVSYADSATLGASFTALESGVYEIGYSAYRGTAGSGLIGISLNSAQLTTNIQSATASTVLAIGSTEGSAGGFDNINWSGYLTAGDVIRPHTDGSQASESYSSFTMSKAGSMKQLNPSSDQKIDIPTHSLRFEGASTRGSTDTAIVKFDTLSNVKGDGFSVANTVANGTVVTMTKAGRLSISSSLVQAGTIAISKNQSVLTALPSASEAIASDSGSTGSSNVSAIIDVVIGDKIRIASNVAISAGNLNVFQLSLSENSVQVALSNVLPQFTTGDSSVLVNTANGSGSTNTRIRRFSNIQTNSGSDVIYSDSATLGASFVANSDGEYLITYTDEFSAADYLGLSLNTSAPSTSVQSIPTSEVLAMSVTPAANNPQTISWSGPLLKGDVIRPHTSSSGTGTTAARTKFTMVKIGKPNITSVDVTPFVNIKSPEDITFRASGAPQTSYTANTPIVFTSVVEDPGTLYNTTTGQYTSPITGNMTVSYYLNTNAAINTITSIYVNGVLRAPTGYSYSATGNIFGSGTVKVLKGDLVDIRSANAWTATGGGNSLTISYQKPNDAVATPIQQISSDTIPFVFKSTAIVDADPVGTFNTYTYAINTNTATISASAPTQTIASMNTNGFQLFSRAYNTASTTASPARVEIKIGKGLKTCQVNAYISAAKTTSFSTDFVSFNANAGEYGTFIQYNEITGVLVLNGGLTLTASNTTKALGVDSVGNAAPTSGYFVFNASMAPTMAALPTLQPRVAYLSDQKASGTAGGSASAGFQTRTLNTIVDSTGIVTSLSSNQFTLPAGTYSIAAFSTMYTTTSNRIRIRNITDSTSPILGLSMRNNTTNADTSSISTASGEITISAPKVFELQHYAGTAKATDGLGQPASSGENELYSQVTITKIR